MRALILFIILTVMVAFGTEALAQGVGASLDVQTISSQKIVPRGAPSTAVPVPVQVFSAKFLCGTIKPTTITSAAGDVTTLPQLGNPLVPGTYLTAINIHNPNFTPITFRKKAVVTNPERQEPGRIGELVTEELKPDAGMEVDCVDILSLLNLVGPDEDPSVYLNENFLKGFVVIQTRDSTPLDVVGVYTSKNVELPQPAGTVGQ
jgi:hypothetical protein